MPIATRESQVLMGGETAFAAAPVNGEAGAPPVYSVTPAGARGMILHINIKGGTTFSLTFTIKAWDRYAATPVAIETILASGARTTNVGLNLTVYPGITETANVDHSTLMPDYWTLAITGTTDTAKIKVVAEYIP